MHKSGYGSGKMGSKTAKNTGKGTKPPAQLDSTGNKAGYRKPPSQLDYAGMKKSGTKTGY